MVYSPHLRVPRNRLARPLTLDGVLPKTNGVVMRVTVIFELEQPRKGGCDAKLP
jgi:hypothetical protein